jgi:putative DNA primase/helicase
MTTESTKMLECALWYIGGGWRVFPVTAEGKQPLTPNGYHDASMDPAQIRAWWTEWPDANIALACAPSGIIALDSDPAHHDETSAALAGDLIHEFATVTQQTPTGGLHFLYRLPAGVTLSNSNKGLPPGFDVRVNGYILLAPSAVTYHGDDARAKGVPDGHRGEYEWMAGRHPYNLNVQPLPAEILAALTAKPAPRPAAPLPVDTAQINTPYARAALERELDTLARTPIGQRNEQLNRSAFSLGQLVAGGALDELDVVQKLGDTALAIGLDERETASTIRSGMKAGMQNPRGVPVFPELTWPSAPTVNGNGKIHDDADAPLDLARLNYKAEDGGILDVWLAVHGPDWLFVNGYDVWHYWHGTHWQPDESQQINISIQTLMQQLNDFAHARKKAAGDDKEALAIANAYIAATKRSRSRVASVEGMAQAHRSTRTADLNAGNLLNLQNGTLDLDTLELHPHDRARVITYCLPYAYDPQATCPRFRRFVREVLVLEGTTTPDDDLIMLFQELAGYTLTTDTRHEIMVWLSGEGGNGKTVAISVLRELLGGMAGNVDFQTLGMAGNYDLAELPGKRLIFSTESKRGGHMAEELLRRIVSGERINTRAIYGKPFEFDPVAKIWWAMNDKPVIKDTSNATWRRMKLIPFYRTFSDAEKDIHLIDKLRQELPGILNWSLEGLKRLRENGCFTQAAAADAAANDYRRESNPVAQWIAECTEKAPDNLFPTMSSAAYANYKTWCEANGRSALNSTNFGTEVKRAGIAAKRSGRGVQLNLTLLDGESV